MTVRTGADAIVGTLADCGVTVCFANPGTSEMHLVAALDREPRIRPVLCLFEGVATGAADGFARIAGAPAMTLLHLGPGYANGAANLHNARRAFSPVVTIVGDHATWHGSLDAPLSSDIAALAATSSIWVGTATAGTGAAAGAAASHAASRAESGGPATLIVPADVAWSPDDRAAAPRTLEPPRLDTARVATVARAVAGASRPAILLGGRATASAAALAAAARLAAAGATILCDTFVARQVRGGGRFEPVRLGYFAEDALAQLSGHDVLVLAGTASPVSFFAYPDRPSRLVPDGTVEVVLCDATDDVVAHLLALADALGAPSAVASAVASAPNAPVVVGGIAAPAVPCGVLDPHKVGASLARHMRAGTIVSDDAVTSSGAVFAATMGGVEHDWLSLTGGAIGQALPVAIGAAVARPATRVVALTGDGAAMYTVQALWTMARERLDITVIVFANRAYRILEVEYGRTGSGLPGRAARAMLDLDDPPIDWCELARSMGVRALSCDEAVAFDDALAEALQNPGPRLIEARIA